jgi:hypothetical protein
MRRIVFSISFFRQALPLQLAFASPTSRRKFYTHVERSEFSHSLDPSRKSADFVARWLAANERDRSYLLQTLEISPFYQTQFQ